MLTLPTPQELTALKEIAAAATPGPWAWGQTPVSTPSEALEICRQNIEATKAPADLFCEVFLEDGRRTALIGNGPTSAANAAFIAVFNPHAAIALLDLIDAQQKQLAERDAVLEEAASACDALESDLFDMYKGRGRHDRFNPARGDIGVSGQSDGAGQCAAVIRALKAAP